LKGKRAQLCQLSRRGDTLTPTPKQVMAENTNPQAGRLPRSPMFYGWLIVGVCLLINFVSIGGRSSFTVFILPLEADFGWDRGAISLAASIGLLVNGFTQPFLGRVYDRYGARKVVIPSLLILGVSMVLLMQTFHLLFLIGIYGIVQAVATSGAGDPITGAMLAKWFRRHRATVLGISMAGASIGGMLLVPFTQYLIDATHWRTAWVVLGVLVMAFALPGAFFILRESPQKMGLQPDGDAEPERVVGRSSKGPVEQAKGPLETDSWRRAFKTAPIWQMCGAYFVCGATTAIMGTHFVPYAVDKGVTESTAALAFGIMNGLNIFGLVGISLISDKMGRKNLLALVYATRGLGYAALLLLPGGWGIWTFVGIGGFSWWATAPLTTSLTADVYGLRTLGTMNSMAFLAHQIGSAAAVQFGGEMRDLTGSYAIPFAIVGMLLIPAALSSFAIREKKYSIRYQSLSPTLAS